MKWEKTGSVQSGRSVGELEKRGRCGNSPALLNWGVPAVRKGSKTKSGGVVTSGIGWCYGFAGRKRRGV